jgi:hypothetical protein
MPEIIETTVYKYDELSDVAKEKARDWFRTDSAQDEWWDSTFEDVTECGKLLGIQIDNIYFSGFSSQGDGACFEGRYSYAKKARDAISAYTGGMETLENIANELQELQRKNFYRLEAKVKHSGHYSHEYCTDIDVFNSFTGDYVPAETHDEMAATLRRFMKWIYRELENYYNDQNSDESVDENIRCNEYTFDINGNREG